MTRSTTRIVALAAVIVMVSSVLAPTAVGAAAAGNATVTTDDPTDVTDTSATLNGNLTALENASNATVWFEYWPEDDNGTAGNTTVTPGQTVNSTGAFAETVDLEANTTYGYVAYAETEGGEAVNGDVVRFDTDVEDWTNGELTFGQRVSAYAHSLLATDLDGPLGAHVSEFVVANNPGADNRPDHAGPSHDDGTEADDSDDDEDGDDNGPPDHANNDEKDSSDAEDEDADDAETDEADEETETEDEDDDADDEEDDDEDDERGGPPEHANNEKND